MGPPAAPPARRLLDAVGGEIAHPRAGDRARQRFQYANGSRWGRVVDVIPGPDGSLYVTDDQAGAVYRITP